MNRNQPGVVHIPKLAKILNVSIDALFTGAYIDEIDVYVNKYVVTSKESDYQEAVCAIKST